MQPFVSVRRQRWTWRAFEARDRRAIEHQLRSDQYPCCPGCGECLEARPGTRLASVLPLGAVGYDLDCRDCRRFMCIIQHTPRSLRLIRMRRFAAAVGAVETRPALGVSLRAE